MEKKSAMETTSGNQIKLNFSQDEHFFQYFCLKKENYFSFQKYGKQCFKIPDH
jgi:hypothetical protein